MMHWLDEIRTPARVIKTLLILAEVARAFNPIPVEDKPHKGIQEVVSDRFDR